MSCKRYSCTHCSGELYMLCQCWIASLFTLKLYQTEKSWRFRESECNRGAIYGEQYIGRHIGGGSKVKEDKEAEEGKNTEWFKINISFFYKFIVRPLVLLLWRWSKKECLHQCREDIWGKKSLICKLKTVESNKWTRWTKLVTLE